MQQDTLPPSRYSGSLIVGVDVGGTKVAAGVVDARGQLLSRVKLPTDTSQPTAALYSIANAIEQAMQEAGVGRDQITGIGLGIPGLVDPQRGVCLNSTNLSWRNVAVSSWLQQRFGLPCTIENDVSAGALGEYHYGAGDKQSVLLYLSLGTGIAAKVLINGSLYAGAHGMPGEIGHAIFVPDGPPCACGGHGCLEALAAGPAIARRATELLHSEQTSLLRSMLARQETLQAEQVFEAAQQGDEVAQQAIEEAADHLANAIHLLAMSFDPELIVLGGGLASQKNPLTEAIRSGVVRRLERAPILREILTPEQICLTRLQRDAGILGAAALVTTNNP